MMDRGHTPISQLQPGEIDWNAIFAPQPAGLAPAPRGTRWFHTGGVFCALSPNSAAVAREAMQSAQRHGVIVSFDCNYRPSLWKSSGGRQASVDLNRSLMPFVDVLFGHEGDIARTLGESSHGPVWHTLESFAPMAARVTAEFPSLKVIASTVRKPITANRNGWGAFAYAHGTALESIQFPDLDIFDRVGGGDSFAAGLIYGLTAARGLQFALDCGVAHGALAMTTPGDSSQATLPEVERLMQGGSAATIR
jgi:2-dehydro-3-deoxygluconokinase